MTPAQQKYIKDWESIAGRDFLWPEDAKSFMEAVHWNNGHMEDVVAELVHIPAPIPLSA